MCSLISHSFLSVWLLPQLQLAKLLSSYLAWPLVLKNVFAKVFKFSLPQLQFDKDLAKLWGKHSYRLHKFNFQILN
jgi:hypothetical protein